MGDELRVKPRVTGKRWIDSARNHARIPTYSCFRPSRREREFVPAIRRIRAAKPNKTACTPNTVEFYPQLVHRLSTWSAFRLAAVFHMVAMRGRVLLLDGRHAISAMHFGAVFGAVLSDNRFAAVSGRQRSPRGDVTTQTLAGIRDVSRQLGPVLTAAVMFTVSDV